MINRLIGRLIIPISNLIWDYVMKIIKTIRAVILACFSLVIGSYQLGKYIEQQNCEQAHALFEPQPCNISKPCSAQN